MIEWYKHHKREDTIVSHRKVWRSKCGHYRIEYSEIFLGVGKDRWGADTGFPPVYRVMAHQPWGGWQILGDDFKKLNTARAALDYYAEHGTLPPKKKRRKKVVHADDLTLDC